MVVPRFNSVMSHEMQETKARNVHPMGNKTLRSVWNECLQRVTRAIGGPLLRFVLHVLFRIKC